MDNDTILNIISGILLILGLVGSVFPKLPGVLLSFVGLILFKYSGSSDYSWTTLFIALLFILLGLLLDYILPVFLKKKLIGTKYGLLGSAFGLVLGFIFPVVGFVIGPFVGSFIAEVLFAKSSPKVALKSAFWSFSTFFLKRGYNIVLSLVFISYFFYQLKKH